MKNIKDIDNINKLLDNPNNIMIILLFANWCGACQQFKPIWNSTIKEVKDSPNVLTADVESEDFQNLNIDTGNIIGYPTVEVHKNGKKIGGFVGGKNEEQLKQFLHKYLNQSGGKRKTKRRKRKTKTKRHKRKTKTKRRKRN